MMSRQRFIVIVTMERIRAIRDAVDVYMLKWHVIPKDTYLLNFVREVMQRRRGIRTLDRTKLKANKNSYPSMDQQLGL